MGVEVTTTKAGDGKNYPSKVMFQSTNQDTGACKCDTGACKCVNTSVCVGYYWNIRVSFPSSKMA
jgi:hypothetical protein